MKDKDFYSSAFLSLCKKFKVSEINQLLKSEYIHADNPMNWQIKSTGVDILISFLKEFSDQEELSYSISWFVLHVHPNDRKKLKVFENSSFRSFVCNKISNIQEYIDINSYKNPWRKDCSTYFEYIKLKETKDAIIFFKHQNVAIDATWLNPELTVYLIVQMILWPDDWLDSAKKLEKHNPLPFLLPFVGTTRCRLNWIEPATLHALQNPSPIILGFILSGIVEFIKMELQNFKDCKDSLLLITEELSNERKIIFLFYVYIELSIGRKQVNVFGTLELKNWIREELVKCSEHLTSFDHILCILPDIRDIHLLSLAECIDTITDQNGVDNELYSFVIKLWGKFFNGLNLLESYYNLKSGIKAIANLITRHENDVFNALDSGFQWNIKGPRTILLLKEKKQYTKVNESIVSSSLYFAIATEIGLVSNETRSSTSFIDGLCGYGIELITAIDYRLDTAKLLLKISFQNLGSLYPYLSPSIQDAIVKRLVASPLDYFDFLIGLSEEQEVLLKNSEDNLKNIISIAPPADIVEYGIDFASFHKVNFALILLERDIINKIIEDKNDLYRWGYTFRAYALLSKDTSIINDGDLVEAQNCCEIASASYVIFFNLFVEMIDLQVKIIKLFKRNRNNSTELINLLSKTSLFCQRNVLNSDKIRIRLQVGFDDLLNFVGHLVMILEVIDDKYVENELFIEIKEKLFNLYDFKIVDKFQSEIVLPLKNRKEDISDIDLNLNIWKLFSKSTANILRLVVRSSVEMQ